MCTQIIYNNVTKRKFNTIKYYEEDILEESELKVGRLIKNFETDFRFVNAKFK